MEKEADLKKTLGTKEIFCIAAGAMISSGLFVLPSVVYSKAGPSIILAYFFASLLVVPAMLSKVELATAMPKSGGTYFFVHRSLGPLLGTFAGFANWFSISMKGAFALVGVGIILEPWVGAAGTSVKLVAVGFTVLFTVVNLLSVKESGTFQVVLVFGLIAILLFYIFGGMRFIDVHRYVPFKPGGWGPTITATGTVFIAFGGLTKAASVAEEVDDPGKTIPRGMFSAFLVVSLLYVLAVFVTVGLLDAPAFSLSLTPLSSGAGVFSGRVGSLLLLAAAVAAFLTTANAGLMAASRVPLAMAKDNLIPSFFSKVSVRFKTPIVSILVTMFFMVLVILVLDLEALVKVASTMMLLLFMFVNLSVIIMRESGIVSYRPGFRAPFYPAMQIAGIVAYAVLILRMGTLPLLITGGFFTLSLAWYVVYSKRRGNRESALIRVVQRVTSSQMQSNTLSDELREILRVRDNIVEDRFDRIIRNAAIIDMNATTRDDLFRRIADVYSERLDIPADRIFDLLNSRERESTTVIHSGLAIPHIIIEGRGLFDIVAVRVRSGVPFEPNGEPVHIVFALAGSADERTFHLQALMAIAQIVRDTDFAGNWNRARNVEDLRNLILLAERVRKGML